MLKNKLEKILKGEIMLTYSIEELQAQADRACEMARKETFEKGLPWIYRDEDMLMIFEYKNGAKVYHKVDEDTGALTIVKVIPGE